MVLRDQRLGEDDELPCAFAVAALLAHERERGEQRAKFAIVVHEGLGATHVALYPRELQAHRLRIRHLASRVLFLFFLGVVSWRALEVGLLEVGEEQIGVGLALGRLPTMHRAETARDAREARREGASGRRHATVKPDEQELAMAAPKRDDVRLEQVLRDVVVEGALFHAHLVFEEPSLPIDEGLLEELLRLPA